MSEQKTIKSKEQNRKSRPDIRMHNVFEQWKLQTQRELRYLISGYAKYDGHEKSQYHFHDAADSVFVQNNLSFPCKR
jgi:hypothetical protein